MLGFFRKKSDKPTKSLLVFTEKDDGIISVTFSSKDLKYFKGTWITDFKSRLDMPPFSIYELGANKTNYIKEGNTVLQIKTNQTNNSDYFKSKIIQLKSHESGEILYFKSNGDELNEGDLICELHRNRVFEYSNHPNSSVYFGYFNKFSAPGSLTLKKWLVNNGQYITKGQHLYEMDHYDNDNYGRKSISIAPRDGIVEILSDVNDMMFMGRYETTLIHNDLMYIIFKDEEVRFDYKFKNIPQIIKDNFSQSKIIQWECVGKNFGSVYSSYDMGLDIGGIQTTSDHGYDLIFSFENHNGNDYIVFYFFSKQYKLNKGDKVYFLFESGNVANFEFYDKHQKNNKYEGFYSNKSLITLDELELFQSDILEEWKVEINSTNQIIRGGIRNNWYEGKTFHSVLKSFVNDYNKVVEKEIENYSPLLEKLHNKLDGGKSKSEQCYVYLMVDTTNGFHKMGISNSPEYRESTLQSEKPTIELLCAKKYPSRKLAESIEKALHNTYSEQRLRGEWFELSEKDVTEISEMLN